MAKSDKSVAERTDRSRFLTTQADSSVKTIHDPVNMWNPRELTVQGIADIILALTGPKSIVERRPLPADDPKVRRPDISRAQALSGWNPQVALEDGIKRTIDYFRWEVLSGTGVCRAERGISA